jgi:hypothetical protein
VVRFVFASLGRAALTAATILLIREFLSGALGGSGGGAARAAQVFGASTVLWATVVLLLLAHLEPPRSLTTPGHAAAARR